VRILSVVMDFLLTACGTGKPNDYLRMYNIPPPTTERFIHCHSYGCKNRVEVTLPQSTEKKIKYLFKNPSKNAAQEQDRIISALQIFEQDVGALAKTNQDKRGTFRVYEGERHMGFQQDCIDESTNTTTYLSLLDQMKLLKFYRPVFPSNRQPFFGGAPWWHQSAVIQNIKTNKKYAVDTWFRDNGQKGFIIPLQEWKDGWMAPKLEKP